MTRVYLVRHGRTALNASGALRGRLDPSLDDVGRREAAQLARLILGSHDAMGPVVSSTLRRAFETAWPIAQGAKRSIDRDPDLIDRDYGKWAGRSPAEVVRQWGSLDAAPGVEDLRDVRERVRRALESAADRTRGEHAVVVVAHDVVNRVLLADLDPSLGPPDAIRQPTGCFNVLERVGGRWLVAEVGVVPGSSGKADPGI